MRNSKLSMRRSEDRVVKRLPAAEGNCALLSALGQACPTSLCLLSVSQALKALSQLGAQSPKGISLLWSLNRLNGLL